MKNDKLAGKTALVTGAARRIGRDIAIALAESGVNVVIHYRRSTEEAASLRKEVIERGVKAWLVQADFERLPESRELFENSVQCAGSIDFLINNASSFISKTRQDIDFAELMRDIQINAWSPFVLSREFARHFNRGKIVNLLDTRIAGYDRTHLGYILSKKLLLSLTEILAVEFAPHISVNAIAPGLILPPAGKDERYLERLAPMVPLEKHGSPGDISDTVLYLLGSDFVTGQVIYVDGGRHLKEPSHGSHHNQ
jgi:pteridine reductase